VIDAAGNKVKLPRGASDAALLPHHVDVLVKMIEPLPCFSMAGI
jgi:hypothetical protein